jgi:hypothetical protein
MKYADEMGSGAMIYRKIGSGIHKLMEGGGGDSVSIVYRDRLAK